MKSHSLRTLTLAVAAGTLMIAFGASAYDDPMSMDTNKDGMISASEHAAGVKSEWSKLDAVGEGRITSSEYESGSRSMFSKWDTNGDGNLSAAEIAAGNKPMTDQPR